MTQAQAQLQLQAQQAVAERMSDVCFKRCVTAPVEKLSDKQRRCMDACTGAFLEGFGVAAETLNNIAKKQSAAHE